MKRTAIVLALLGLGLGVAAEAARRHDNSLRNSLWREMQAQRAADLPAASTASGSRSSTAAAGGGGSGGGGGSAPTDAQVGDANSFGRNVRWLGLAQTGVITLTSDCTPDPAFPPSPDDHCVVTNPQPAVTSFDFTDVGRITLPARSTNSLVCQWVTPIVFYNFQNTTGVFQPNARLTLIPYMTIENPVLADPALVDPGTGLPLAGKIEMPSISATTNTVRSLDAGERELNRINFTRACIGGILTRRMLMETYGLSAAQANSFFNSETTLRFHVRGNASMVTDASILYGFRFQGD